MLTASSPHSKTALPDESPFSQEAIEQALAHWDISVSSYELVSLSENVVYKVLAQEGSFALRIHRPGYNSNEELECELMWCRALNQSNIDTPAQRVTQTGANYANVEVQPNDFRAVGLIDWLDGKQMAELIEEAEPEVAIEHYATLGVLIARMHTQAVAWNPPALFTRKIWDASGLVGLNPLWGKFWQSQYLTTDEAQLMAQARETLFDHLLHLPKSPETYSLIHADLHPHNVLVIGTQLYAIDFDDCGFGWHYYDLAVALHHLRDNEHFDAIEQALLRGYRSERSLPDAEHHLPLFYLVRSLLGLAWISARPELSTDDKIRNRIEPLIAQVNQFFSR